MRSSTWNIVSNHCIAWGNETSFGKQTLDSLRNPPREWQMAMLPSVTHRSQQVTVRQGECRSQHAQQGWICQVVVKVFTVEEKVALWFLDYKLCKSLRGKKTKIHSNTQLNLFSLSGSVAWDVKSCAAHDNMSQKMPLDISLDWASLQK